VGAALLTESGKIFTGCNVENVSLGLTIRAERSALAAAIAVVTDFREPVFPCGACRQVLAEFNHDLEIVTLTTGRPHQDRFTFGIASRARARK
jgi:cytidine deaminase